MKEENIKHYTIEQIREMRARGEDQTDWKRLAEMRDEDIDFSDIPELDESFWKNATLRYPQAKERVTMRLDKEILDFFRSQGRGYQTRINAVLASYIAAQKSDVES